MRKIEDSSKGGWWICENRWSGSWELDEGRSCVLSYGEVGERSHEGMHGRKESE
jgi:hypothetical protein